MPANLDDLVHRVLQALGTTAFERAFPQIGSKTLQAALELIIDVPELEARLFIPHYWAVYYHDGRGPFGPKDARFLVFFANPKDDPRLPGGKPPERLSQVRRLTRNEFFAGLAENSRRRQVGLPPFMLVIKNEDGTPGRVGPAASHPFFDNDGGMRGFAATVSGPLSEVGTIFDSFVQEIVDEQTTKPQTARIPLRFEK